MPVQKGQLSELARGHCPRLPGCESGLMREYSGLDTVAGTELRQDMRHMGLDGRLGEEELGCDLGVGQTTGHRAQHVEIAAGQVGQPGNGGLPGR